MNGKSLHFMVEDDGIGRQAAAQLGSTGEKFQRSMSSEITHERLQIINRKKRRKDTFRITDLYDAEGNPAGTRVKFELPVSGS